MQIANVSELSSWTCTSLGCKIVAATLATGVVATGIFAYLRIYADSALPFENWKNLVGLKVSKPLSADELKGGGISSSSRICRTVLCIFASNCDCSSS